VERNTAPGVGLVVGQPDLDGCEQRGGRLNETATPFRTCQCSRRRM
jgi:hypothetical protein